MCVTRCPGQAPRWKYPISSTRRKLSTGLLGVREVRARGTAPHPEYEHSINSSAMATVGKVGTGRWRKKLDGADDVFPLLEI